MKTILTLLVFIYITASSYAQAPEMMSYQSVVRDADNNLITNTTIGVRISIIQGTANGEVVYAETHKTMSNANALITLEIGTGEVEVGMFNDINWGKGPYFIKTELDLEGGMDYSIAGTHKILSVPYALHSNTAESLTGSALDGEPLFNNAEEGDLITYDGTNWVKKKALIGSAGGGQAQNNMQPWLGINHIIALQGIFPSRNSAEPFIAEIIMFGGNFAPRGWAFCDGQLLAISQNSALFSLLGTTYGGDGRTTFGLPDLRGRTAVHPGTGPSLTNRRLGEKGGTETNVMSVQEMPPHSHTIIYE